MSTYGTLARESESTQGTLARGHVSTQDTLVHEHVIIIIITINIIISSLLNVDVS